MNYTKENIWKVVLLLIFSSGMLTAHNTAGFEMKVNTLLQKMTLEDKIGQLNLATYVNENNSTYSTNDKIKIGEIGTILKSNYRLKKGSAGLNSGSEVLAQPTVIDGNNRHKGKARDRGAFEQ